VTYDEKYGTAVRNGGDNRMRGMRSARWMTPATDTHSEYVANTYCFSTVKIVTRTRFNIICIPKLLVSLRFSSLNGLEYDEVHSAIGARAAVNTYIHTYTMMMMIMMMTIIIIIISARIFAQIKELAMHNFCYHLGDGRGQY
jgi:hypothetical protein